MFRNLMSTIAAFLRSAGTAIKQGITAPFVDIYEAWAHVWEDIGPHVTPPAKATWNGLTHRQGNRRRRPVAAGDPRRPLLRRACVKSCRETSAKVNSAIERIEAQIAAKRVALDVNSARPADPVAIARAMANHVCHGGKRPSTFGLTAAQRLWIEGLDQSQAVRVQQVDAKTIGAFLAGGAQVKGFAPLESAKDVADFERGYRRGVAKIDAETAAIPLPVGVTV